MDNIAEKIAYLVSRKGGRTFFVGGFVRDKILGIENKDMDIEVVTIPGITAAASGASLLGAPLMHDFAVISLSDRLTDWNTIRDRIKFAAAADGLIVGTSIKCDGNWRKPVEKERVQAIAKALTLPEAQHAFER